MIGRLPVLLLLFAATVLSAKVADFLIGRSGNKWLKERLIFRPWYRLQLANPLETVYEAADIFARTTNRLFGDKLVSWWAWVVSTLFGAGIVSIGIFIGALFKHRPFTTQYTSSFRQRLAWYGIFLLINPVFDFISFAVTRYLAQQIARLRKLRYALTLWTIDVVCCVIITLLTYYTADIYLNAVAPHYGVFLWLHKYVVHDFAIFAAATGWIPTLLHVLFFIAAMSLSLAETFRRGLCLLLERFDESGDRLLTILATVVGGLATFLGVISNALQGK